MVELFVCRKEDIQYVFMYMTSEGLVVKAENDTIDYSPLKDYVGDIIKILYLPDENFEAIGDAEVEVCVITHVGPQMICWE